MRTMKQWMEKNKFRPRSSVSSPTHVCKPCKLGVVKGFDDDTDCPCGGCVAWGNRNNNTSSSVQAVMSELTLALLRHNIDTRQWGQEGRKSAWDLVWEIQQGFTEVKVDHTEKEKRLTRFAHNLRIRLHAETRDHGLCVLHEKDVRFPGKYITKKMTNVDQDWRAKCMWVLERYFKLDKQFVLRHIVVLNHRVLQTNQVSTYYPPLFAKYTIHEVDIFLSNASAVDVMGLPWGVDFETKVYDEANVKHREQLWTWQQIHQGKEVIKQELHRAYAYGESFYKLVQEETESSTVEQTKKKVVDNQAANKTANTKSVATGPRRKSFKNTVVAELRRQTSMRISDNEFRRQTTADSEFRRQTTAELARRRASRPTQRSSAEQKGNELVVDSTCQAWRLSISQ